MQLKISSPPPEEEKDPGVCIAPHGISLRVICFR